MDLEAFIQFFSYVLCDYLPVEREKDLAMRRKRRPKETPAKDLGRTNFDHSSKDNQQEVVWYFSILFSRAHATL